MDPDWCRSIEPKQVEPVKYENWAIYDEDDGHLVNENLGRPTVINVIFNLQKVFTLAKL